MSHRFPELHSLLCCTLSMDSRFNGDSFRSKTQELGCNNLEPFQQFSKREKLHRQTQNLQQENGEKTKTLNYWGKVRKCAVRTYPAIMRPIKKKLEVDDASHVKTRSMVKKCEQGSDFWSPEGEIGNARQVFEEMPERVMTENKGLTSAELARIYGIGSSEKSETMNIVGERKNLLKWFRAEYELLRKRTSRNEICNRIDHMAYNVLKESGQLFLNEKKLGPIQGVEIEDHFMFRLELVIMGIHAHHFRGIDYMEDWKGRVVAVSIVATEGYGDCMKADELIYTGEGGGNFEGTSKGVMDQELKGGNLALKNSMEAGNYVRVVRGVKSRCKNISSKTIFVYDGLYKVVNYDNKIGINGKTCFEFNLKRCSGQKIIDWTKYRQSIIPYLLS